MAKFNLKAKIQDIKYRYKHEESTADKMSVKEMASMGGVSFGKETLSNMKSSFYNLFLATVLGFDANTIALLVSVTTIIGYIKAPFTSVILDNTNTKWGRFKPYVVIGAPIILTLNFMFFLSPIISTEYDVKVVYVFAVEILTNLIGGFADGAWGYLKLCVTREDKDKEKFLSVAKITSSIAGGIGGTIPVIIDIIKSFDISLKYVFLVMACIMYPIGMVTVFMGRNVRERIVIPKKEKVFKNFKDFLHQLKLIFMNKNKIISWGGKIGNIFNYVADIACAYVYMYCYGMYSWITVVWIMGAVVEWIGLVFCSKLIDKVGARWVPVMYKFMMGSSMVVLCLCGYGTSLIYLLIPGFCRMWGAALEYAEGIANSMFETDIWDHYEWKYGVRNEATTDLIGGYLFIPLDLLKPVFYAFIFNKIGFQEGENVVQTEATKQGLFHVYTMGIAVGSFLDIIPFLLIKLDKKTMAKVRMELKEREIKRQMHVEEELNASQEVIADEAESGSPTKEQSQGGMLPIPKTMSRTVVPYKRRGAVQWQSRV